MPYGIDKESPEQTKWMEKCVSSVMKQNKSKSSAIAICKAQLQKNGLKVKKSEDGSDDVSIDSDVESEISKTRKDQRHRRITWGSTTI